MQGGPGGPAPGLPVVPDLCVPGSCAQGSDYPGPRSQLCSLLVNLSASLALIGSHVCFTATGRLSSPEIAACLTLCKSQVSLQRRKENWKGTREEVCLCGNHTGTWSCTCFIPADRFSRFHLRLLHPERLLEELAQEGADLFSLSEILPGVTSSSCLGGQQEES